MYHLHLEELPELAGIVGTTMVPVTDVKPVPIKTAPDQLVLNSLLVTFDAPVEIMGRETPTFPDLERGTAARATEAPSRALMIEVDFILSNEIARIE